MKRIEIIAGIINAKIKDFSENAEYWEERGNFENVRIARAVVAVLKDARDMLEMDEQQLKYIEDSYK